ncbi:MAG TPA: nucleotide disphospho-sugar-binding domain-containing protein [Chloroflexota bacterium]|nr:nucleotide disphospho-sugar-binding domain-containing protein [Chloroflexota bacterium]
MFATLAADGHFNPLTGLAVHLRAAGHDVRWYTGAGYAARLERLGIPHLPYRRAREITGENIPELFPERARLKGPALIRFDFEHVFLSNIESYFQDIHEINDAFPFQVLFCDTAFMAARLVRQVLGKHVCAVGVAPVLETSKDTPPNFLGLQPAKTPLGRFVHQAMAAAMDRMVLAPGRDLYNGILARHGLPPVRGSIYDEFYRCQDVVFQNGVPGFEYPRRESNPTLRFVGPLLPYRSQAPTAFPYTDRLGEQQRVILISQGTVDNKDPNKLIAPALEALVDSGALLVVGTGYENTEQLRQAYPQSNVVIEDYVDFEAVLKKADLLICNGGYGSVLLSLSKGVPVVGAGVREGKNDVNARVEFFGVGINLRSENPPPERIRRAVDRVLSEPSWKARAMQLREELSRYRPYELIDEYLATAVPPSADAQQHTGVVGVPRAAATRAPMAPIRQSG